MKVPLKRGSQKGSKKGSKKGSTSVIWGPKVPWFRVHLAQKGVSKGGPKRGHLGVSTKPVFAGWGANRDSLLHVIKRREMRPGSQKGDLGVSKGLKSGVKRGPKGVILDPFWDPFWTPFGPKSV